MYCLHEVSLVGLTIWPVGPYQEVEGQFELLKDLCKVRSSEGLRQNLPLGLPLLDGPHVGAEGLGRDA